MGSFGSRGRFVHASSQLPASSSHGWFGSTFRSLSASVDILPLAKGVAHRTTSDRSSSYFCISVSRSGAQLPDAARFRARSTSHPVAARDGCTNIPLTAGRGSGERNHSSNRRFRGHGLPRFVHPDPPELIRSWKICESAERLSSGGLHHGSLNDDAGGDIFPQRHQQLARQRHDSSLLHAAAVAFDPFFEPQSKRRLRLMA